MQIDINDVKKIETIKDAENFYKSWSFEPFLSEMQFSPPREEDMPVTLIAFSFITDDGKFPSISCCDKNGELTDLSKFIVGC